jgi:hypothetical protein
VKSEELKTLVEVLQELGSTCDETANVLSGAAQEAHCAKHLLGKPMSERERARLVKLGLDVMHFPGFIPSIFLNELFHHKFVGVSLVAIGLIQEKRSPMHAVNVYETFQETIQKLRKMTNKMV